MRHDPVVGTGDLPGALGRYAGRLHGAVGARHHVASPLGAWLLLALGAGALPSGGARVGLEDVLGVRAEEATEWASGLLGHRHPSVGLASAAWTCSPLGRGAFRDWLDGLPNSVRRGEMPDQEGLDQWAQDNTLGIIQRFPLEVDPSTVLILASALATKVSWTTPFDLVPAAALGTASPWASHLGQVLLSPSGVGHSSWITDTAQAGRVGVHTAYGGRTPDLRVTTVIAGADVPHDKVIGAAHDLAQDMTDGLSTGRVSLWDLPLGEGELWGIEEEPVRTTQGDGRPERCRAALPAWTVSSEIELGLPGLGFAELRPLFADLIGPAAHVEAAQRAAATYSRTGFEAAAVTGMAVALSARQERDGILRKAVIRFSHPFAAVATAVDRRRQGPWHGLPVFSGWIAEPSEPADLE